MSKYLVKTRSKNAQEEEQNRLEIMIKTTQQHAQVYEISVWACIEIVNNFIRVVMSLCIQGMKL